MTSKGLPPMFGLPWEQKAQRSSETVRYNKRSLEKIVDQLKAWIDSSQDSLDNEESRDYPNEDRVSMLGERIESLQAAVDSLEEIE